MPEEDLMKIHKGFSKLMKEKIIEPDYWILLPWNVNVGDIFKDEKGNKYRYLGNDLSEKVENQNAK